MPAPFVLLQLTDLHIGASWGDWNPTARMTKTVECVLRLAHRPDAILRRDLLEAAERSRLAAEARAPRQRTLPRLAWRWNRRAPAVEQHPCVPQTR